MGGGSATLSATFGSTTTTRLVNVTTAPSLLHRYSFTADANDSVGTANGTLVGGAFITNGTVALSGVGSSGTAGDYVDLPNNMLTNVTTISMEVWATDKGSLGWARIWDFGNSAGSCLSSRFGAVPPDGSASSTRSTSSPRCRCGPHRSAARPGLVITLPSIFRSFDRRS
jgi:hypothetical protein